MIMELVDLKLRKKENHMQILVENNCKIETIFRIIKF